MRIEVAIIWIVWLVSCLGQKKKLRHGEGRGAKRSSHTHKSVFGYDMIDKTGGF